MQVLNLIIQTVLNSELNRMSPVSDFWGLILREGSKIFQIIQKRRRREKL